MEDKAAKILRRDDELTYSCRKVSNKEAVALAESAGIKLSAVATAPQLIRYQPAAADFFSFVLPDVWVLPS